MELTCGTCQTSYEPKSYNTKAFIYLENSQCNYIVSRCQNKHADIKYLATDEMAELINQFSLKPTTSARADDYVLVNARQSWQAYRAINPLKDDELPEPTREMSREIRDFACNYLGSDIYEQDRAYFGKQLE